MYKNFEKKNIPIQLQILQLKLTRIFLRDKNSSDLSAFNDLAFLLTKIAYLSKTKFDNSIDFCGVYFFYNCNLINLFFCSNFGSRKVFN